MKRRSFVKGLGAGLSTGFIKKNVFSASPIEYFNPYDKNIKSLEEAKSKEGLLMIRLSFSGNQVDREKFKSGIKAKNCNINRVKNYFFETGEDSFKNNQNAFDLNLDQSDEDIVVLWLDDVNENTSIDPGFGEIKVSELIKNNWWESNNGPVTINANLLFDKEIGEINLPDYSIDISGDNFRFTIMADPQGGDPEAENSDSPTRMKIHNAFIEEMIDVANELDPQPAFNIVLGDFVDSKGQEGNFIRMLEFYKKLKTPYLIEVGNHETAYSAKFKGYDMSALDNYFSAQKQINGMEKILYSFNAGNWHFIVWPDPLRSSFFPSHPHYFDWLEHDLEKNKNKPTVFLQHIPIHPIGINPLINYVESVDVKRMLLNILSQHGNVKYIFSGHVHIPLKASLKTAVSYKGMNLINLPPAGYRPRAFGEEDYFGGPSQGLAVIDIKGDDIDVQFKTVTRERFKYPKSFPAFDTEKYPLWLNYKWELKSNHQLVNGKFENALKGWHRRFVYMEDKEPSNICEVETGKGKEKSPALYMLSKKRGYDIPGQDRLPQEINRICQVIDLSPGKIPSISFSFKLDEDHYFPEALSSPYIWIEGFNGSLKKLNLVYSTGKMYMNLGGRYAQNRVVFPKHFHLPSRLRKWNEAFLNIAEDFETQSGRPFSGAGINKLAINLGTWTINDGHQQECGIYFDHVSLDFNNTNQSSHVDGIAVTEKAEDQLWSQRIDHVAGEHQYASQDVLYRDIV